jgi:hypothetical protein
LVEALNYTLEGCGFESRRNFFRFFIDWILPAALWSWGWLSLWRKWAPGLLWGLKVAGECGWQTYHFLVPTLWKSWES